jgi:hypothetical protein
MNKNLILLVPLLLCSCVASKKIEDSALRRVVSSILPKPNNRNWEIVRSTYFRKNRKILVTEKRYYKGKLDGPIIQKIIMNNQILIKFSKYKQSLIYKQTSIYPAGKYGVEILHEDGHLGAVKVSKDSKYIEFFDENNGLLIPVSDLDLKKRIKEEELIKKFVTDGLTDG